ncbi:MAG: hypothetical protein ACRDT4_23395 [Micromonosporaceae bacterium]
MYTVELSYDELRIARSALRSYLNDFGHDEVDVLRVVKRLLAKINDVEAAGDPEASDAESA